MAKKESMRSTPRKTKNTDDVGLDSFSQILKSTPKRASQKSNFGLFPKSAPPERASLMAPIQAQAPKPAVKKSTKKISKKTKKTSKSPAIKSTKLSKKSPLISKKSQSNVRIDVSYPISHQYLSNS